MKYFLFLNTGATSASLRLFGKLFYVIISLFQMPLNSGAQMSDTSFKYFSGILPKVPLFLLFKAVVSLSIYSTKEMNSINFSTKALQV